MREDLFSLPSKLQQDSLILNVSSAFSTGRCWLDWILVHSWRLCCWNSYGKVRILYVKHVSGPNRKQKMASFDKFREK